MVGRVIFILQGCTRKHSLAVHRAEPCQIGFEQGLAVDLHRVDAKMVKEATFKTRIFGNSADQSVFEQRLPMARQICASAERE